MPPRAQGAAVESAGPLPRPALSPEFVALHKRRRIMQAIAELTAENGYSATKIGDIVRRARVARKTLYDNFAGKEEVFLAAFDAAVDEAMQRVEEACAAAAGEWEERLQAGLSAFLAYVAEQPALARMCMIEALSATPAATQRYENAMQRFVDLTGENVPHYDQLPETIEETLVGGVAWIVYQQIRRDEAANAEQLLPELSEFILAPFKGAAEAQGKRAST
ncbi:MAG TPA: TetR/AcrR family transcriptional regulator [Solirubrobacterales bacterium]|nr:TetR/AcrR family transcriptional regulator [Solirubrobacterales bacterium]